MTFPQRSLRAAVPLLPVLLFMVVLVACGTTNSITSTASTPTTATVCSTVTTGTIHSVSNNTLQVTNLQGNDVQAIFTSKTTFTRLATLTSTDLKVGLLISATVTQNSDNTYAALTVSVRNSLTRQGGFTRGSSTCIGQRSRGTGTPGAFGGSGSGSGQSRQIISGTVSQVSGSSLIVTDTSGNDLTVTLTPATRISTQQTVTASNLRNGEAVTVTGIANSQGVINASSVSILQGLPTRQTPATNS